MLHALAHSHPVWQGTECDSCAGGGRAAFACAGLADGNPHQHAGILWEHQPQPELVAQLAHGLSGPRQAANRGACEWQGPACSCAAAPAAIARWAAAALHMCSRAPLAGLLVGDHLQAETPTCHAEHTTSMSSCSFQLTASWSAGEQAAEPAVEAALPSAAGSTPPWPSEALQDASKRPRTGFIRSPEDSHPAKRARRAASV